MTDNERYQQADHYYALKAVQALGQELLNHQSTEGCLATGMLLVHHDIINETPETEVCWTCHIKMLDVLPERDVSADYEPAVFMRYHLILASAAQSINAMRSTRPKSTKWPQNSLGYVDPESQRICPSLGLSQQLLSIIEFTTSLVVDGPFIRRDYKASCAALLEDQLANLHQWTTDVSGKALEIVERTAETYRVAAQIYLQCRFVGYVSPPLYVSGQNPSLMLMLPDGQPDTLAPRNRRTECQAVHINPLPPRRRPAVHGPVPHLAALHRGHHL